MLQVSIWDSLAVCLFACLLARHVVSSSQTRKGRRRKRTTPDDHRRNSSLRNFITRQITTSKFALVVSLISLRIDLVRRSWSFFFSLWRDSSRRPIIPEWCTSLLNTHVSGDRYVIIWEIVYGTQREFLRILWRSSASCFGFLCFLPRFCLFFLTFFLSFSLTSLIVSEFRTRWKL